MVNVVENGETSCPVDLRINHFQAPTVFIFEEIFPRTIMNNISFSPDTARLGQIIVHLSTGSHPNWNEHFIRLPLLNHLSILTLVSMNISPISSPTAAKILLNHVPSIQGCRVIICISITDVFFEPALVMKINDF